MEGELDVSHFKVHFFFTAYTSGYIIQRWWLLCTGVLRKDHTMILLIPSVAINYYCTVDYSPYLNCIIVIKACNL